MNSVNKFYNISVLNDQHPSAECRPNEGNYEKINLDQVEPSEYEAIL